MSYPRLLLIVGLLVVPALSRAADDGYGYPFRGPYAATILGSLEILQPPVPEEIGAKELVLEVFPDRKPPPVFWYSDGLRVTFARQRHKAPLVFLIAGTGSDNLSPSLLFLTKALYKVGFHVVILPSPTNYNFIVAASRSSVPGDLVEDSEDLYHAMEVAWDRVKGKIEVSDFYLAGVSLGGTQAAYVAKIDEERRVFQFRKVLLINPAVNLYTSVVEIESLLNDAPGGPARLGSAIRSVLSRVGDEYRRGAFLSFDKELIFALYRKRFLSREEEGLLIGTSFRISEAGMIFASDVMTHRGYVVPKNVVLRNSDSLTPYFWTSSHLSFIQYFDEYFLPYFQGKRPGLTRQAAIAALSLKAIESYLKSSPKIGAITNEDDFILTPADRDYLRQLFGERIKIWPRGGHMGNFTYKDNIAYVLNFLH